MRHSLPSPVVEAGTTVPTSQQKPPPPGIEPQPPLPQQTNKQTQQQPSIKSSSSRKSKTNKGQKISKVFFSRLQFFQKRTKKNFPIFYLASEKWLNKTF